MAIQPAVFGRVRAAVRATDIEEKDSSESGSRRSRDRVRLRMPQSRETRRYVQVHD
jgi:hypothetical protein